MTASTIDAGTAQTAEQLFFSSLRRADTATLGELLTDDFVLVDVMRGGLVSRAALLDAVGSRQIRFDTIDLLESQARRYGATMIVVGRTRMVGRAGTTEWSVASRYTHVYVEQAGRWRLATAQGTPIAAEP